MISVKLSRSGMQERVLTVTTRPPRLVATQIIAPRTAALHSRTALPSRPVHHASVSARLARLAQSFALLTSARDFIIVYSSLLHCA